jgi:signal transduction histidine kinase
MVQPGELSDTAHAAASDVEDHGVGFDPEAPRDRASLGGFGLLSVREQISRLGGTLNVVSAPKRGTRVSLSVADE